MAEIYKIVFCGLDFAGKTSILKVLEGSYSGLDRIKPTLGKKRTEWDILGFKVINWDLGGQERYRKEYLSKDIDVLRDTNLLIFVVDIQDAERFKEAGTYFNDILSALDSLKIKTPVILCLHKIDPDVIDHPHIIKNLKKLTDMFSAYSSEHGVEISVFKTSIFDRKSLIETFSYGIKQLIPLGVLSEILEEFRQESGELGLIGTILFDQNFFIVGTSFEDITTQNMTFKSINSFITMMRDFQGVYDEDRQINFNLSITNGTSYRFTVQKFSAVLNPYYLLIMGTMTLKIDDIFFLFHEKYLSKIDKSLENILKSIE